MDTKKNARKMLPILVGALFTSLATAPVLAQSAPTTQQLMRMIEAQQKQLDNLKSALNRAQTQAQAAATKADSAAKSAASIPGLPKNVTIGGGIEVEMTSTESFAHADTSDITLAKVETFIDAQPFEFLSTHVQLIYEDDGTDTISLDEAFATLGNSEKYPAYLQAGRWAIPFGGFDTAMSTDPLSKSLGETAESAVLVGLTQNGFTVEGYGYNGDTQQTGEGDNIDQWGLSASYEAELTSATFNIGGGYISNIADSGGLTEGLGDNATALNNYIAGWEIHGTANYGAFTVYAGYMSANESFESGELAFNGQGAKPAAWNLEAAFVSDIMGKETTLAATIQGTKEAFALSYPETRVGGAVTVQVMDSASVTAEYIHDEDYGTSQGGTGNSGHTATLKVAAEF